MKDPNYTNTQNLLNHIHSLRVVSAPDQISITDASRLVSLGYLRQVWINNYALTKAGEKARKAGRK